MSNFQPVAAEFNQDGTLVKIWGPNSQVAFDPSSVAITGGVIGGAGVSADSGLQAWALAQAFRVVSAIRNSDGAISSATIVWPDGTSGTFSGTPSVAAPGALDAWAATYGSKTVTQPAVTRDADGNVTAQPAIAIV